MNNEVLLVYSNASLGNNLQGLALVLLTVSMACLHMVAHIHPWLSVQLQQSEDKLRWDLKIKDNCSKAKFSYQN